MRRNILALTTLLTSTLTLSSVARANEQTNKQAIANRYQAIMKATGKDAYYDVNEHLADAALINSGTMLVSKLIEINPSGAPLRQQNNQIPSIQLTKELTNSEARAKLVGVWKASVFEYGQRFEIIWVAKPNGISYHSFLYQNGNMLTIPLSWHYSGNILTQRTRDGEIGKGSIEFINSNYFVLTILKNSDPRSAGLKRHFYRDFP